jgi:hypothetical protein
MFKTMAWTTPFRRRTANTKEYVQKRKTIAGRLAFTNHYQLLGLQVRVD